MTESSWEASRSAQRKRSHLIILVSLPVVLLVTILFINNRDLLLAPHGKPVQNEPVDSPPKNEESHPSDHDTIPVQHKTVTAPTVDTMPDSGTVLRQRAIAKRSEPDTTVRKKADEQPHQTMVKNADIPAQKKKSVGSQLPDMPHHPFSEMLPPIKCSLNNRKDIVISLSLELFFNDEDDRAVLRLYREDLKVMIMKSVLSAELPDMKIHVLEKHLLKNINSIFDHEIIIALKIRNIQIEKAGG